jgi:hypothetical protein
MFVVIASQRIARMRTRRRIPHQQGHISSFLPRRSAMFEVREIDEAGEGIMARSSEIALLGQMAHDCARRKDRDPTARYRAKKAHKIVRMAERVSVNPH